MVRESQTRVVIIGTGIMARIYAEIISDIDNVELVVAVGNSEKNSVKFSEDFDIPVIANMQVARALDEFNIDFSIVTTPEWVRLVPLKLLVEKHVPILLEKPFCSSHADALQLCKILETGHQYFEVCHVLRSNPRFQALTNLITKGEIGRVKNIYARRNSNSVRVERVLGKFPLTFWLLPHDLDIALRIVPERVVSVFCQNTSSEYSKSDCLTCFLKTESGATITIENSWVTPPISNLNKATIFEVSGTEGRVELTDDEMNVKLFRPDSVVIQPDTNEHYFLDGKNAGYFANFLTSQLKLYKGQTARERQEIINHCMALTEICQALEESRVKGAVIDL